MSIRVASPSHCDQEWPPAWPLELCPWSLPRERDMAASFLLSGSASRKAQHTSQRHTWDTNTAGHKGCHRQGAASNSTYILDPHKTQAQRAKSPFLYLAEAGCYCKLLTLYRLTCTFTGPPGTSTAPSVHPIPLAKISGPHTHHTGTCLYGWSSLKLASEYMYTTGLGKIRHSSPPPPAQQLAPPGTWAAVSGPAPATATLPLTHLTPTWFSGHSLFPLNRLEAEPPTHASSWHWDTALTPVADILSTYAHSSDQQLALHPCSTQVHEIESEIMQREN